MAIDWTIEHGGAFLVASLLHQVQTNLISLVDQEPTRIRATEADRQTAEWPAPSFRDRLVAGHYELRLSVEFQETAGLATFTSDWEIEDDGTALPDSTYREVAADRSQLSSIVGFCIACAVVQVGGGELSGAGVTERIDRDQIDAMISKLSSPGTSLVESVNNVSTRLGCGSLPFS